MIDRESVYLNILLCHTHSENRHANDSINVSSYMHTHVHYTLIKKCITDLYHSKDGKMSLPKTVMAISASSIPIYLYGTYVFIALN
jgi:hypothetical protein